MIWWIGVLVTWNIMLSLYIGVAIRTGSHYQRHYTNMTIHSCLGGGES